MHINLQKKYSIWEAAKFLFFKNLKIWEVDETTMEKKVE